MLLCYPGVQEYNTSHWAFRRLAVMLAREGFHVLRFDWSGTGDSWGETTDGAVDTWLSDVAAACQEVRDASGARSVSIVGMRLGAAIAATACSRNVDAEDLVLWEPVIVGAEYIEELESLDARENMRLLHRVPAARDQLVGFPFPPTLRRSINEIDLYETPPRRAKRVTIIAAKDRPPLRKFGDRLNRAGVESRYVYAPEDASSTNAANRESALLANHSLIAITDVLAGRAESR